MPIFDQACHLAFCPVACADLELGRPSTSWCKFWSGQISPADGSEADVRRGDHEKIARAGKCLKGGFRRVVQICPFGREDIVICAYSDADWAGCLHTLKSTTGRVVYTGCCMIRQCSPIHTGDRILIAGSRLARSHSALSEAKGPKSLGRSLRHGCGEDARLRAFVGAHGTIGFSHRAGLGKAWRKDTAEIGIQGALGRQEPEIVRIGGEHDSADVIIKPVRQDTMMGHVDL